MIYGCYCFIRETQSPTYLTNQCLVSKYLMEYIWIKYHIWMKPKNFWERWEEKAGVCCVHACPSFIMGSCIRWGLGFSLYFALEVFSCAITYKVNLEYKIILVHKGWRIGEENRAERRLYLPKNDSIALYIYHSLPIPSLFFFLCQV